MKLLRCSITAMGLAGLVGLFGPAAAQPPPPAAKPEPVHDGSHDFDFEIGTWKTQLKRLTHPLSGSADWTEYEGTTTVSKVWGGRANLVELDASGPAGLFQGASWRLYNPESHQWSLNFANLKNGTLALPAIGEFHGRRGEFYNQDSFNGKAILVRFVITELSPDKVHFEQAFSPDWGKTWEVNWIATDTRVTSAPGT